MSDLLSNWIEPALPHWYVIYTKRRSEDQAERELQKKGISVFLPKIREVRFRRGKMRQQIEPLFPTYLFAKFTIHDSYYDVKWARGVKCIVGSGDIPIPLDDSIVTYIQEQVDKEGLAKPEPGLNAGDRVRIEQGPLEGLWGVVHGQIDSKGRVKILMDVLHSGAKLELPYSYVKRYG
jgi:transcriptional antiterminator RfaH